MRTWTEENVVEPNEFGEIAAMQTVNAGLYWAQGFVSDDGETLDPAHVVSATVVEHADAILDAMKMKITLE